MGWLNELHSKSISAIRATSNDQFLSIMSLTKENEIQLLFMPWKPVLSIFLVHWTNTEKHELMNWCHYSKLLKSAQSKASCSVWWRERESVYTPHAYCYKCVFTTVNRNFTIGVQFEPSSLGLSPFSSLLSRGRPFTEKLELHSKNKT